MTARAEQAELAYNVSLMHSSVALDFTKKKKKIIKGRVVTGPLCFAKHDFTSPGKELCHVINGDCTQRRE